MPPYLNVLWTDWNNRRENWNFDFQLSYIFGYYRRKAGIVERSANRTVYYACFERLQGLDAAYASAQKPLAI
jgi:hypothetical protein